MANLRRKNGRDKAWKLKYLGVGNESWGCGGSMRPEYYADLYLVVILLIAAIMTATVCSRLPVAQVTMITNGQMY